MKQLLPIFLLLVVLPHTYAQYVPHTAQPFLFASAYNPAFSGIDNFADLKLSYRYQWTGLGSDAPGFINLAYNTRLKQPLDLSGNALRISNISVLNPDLLPKNKRVIHGFGINFFNEKVGQIERIGGGINYAFNYPLSTKTRLSIGASAMVDNSKIDLNKTMPRDPDPFYDELVKNGASQTNLNVRAGILLYSPQYYVGITYYPIVNMALQTSDVATNQIFYQGSLQGGFVIPVASSSSIRPSVLALWQIDNTFAIDYSVKAFIQNKVWFGFTYRDIQSAVGLLGININEKIAFSYSYEMSLSDYSQFTNNSHDLVLAFRFNNLKRQGQYAW